MVYCYAQFTPIYNEAGIFLGIYVGVHVHWESSWRRKVAESFPIQGIGEAGYCHSKRGTLRLAVV